MTQLTGPDQLHALPSSQYLKLRQIDELLCVAVEHPKASALIALQGAQVLRFTPAGSEPVIWLSETATFRRGQSVRGGIPVCWPWFGDAARNPAAVQAILPQGDLPAHGWVRTQPWLLESVTESEQDVRLLFRYPAPAELPASWARQIELSLEIAIGTSLTLCLRCSNRSPSTLTLSQALHSYFAVSHIDQVHIHNLENVPYIDTLDHWRQHSSATALAITGETDRIYQQTPAVIEIRDAGWHRNIRIETMQSGSAVIWNPWIEKSKRLSQFPNDAYQHMLCIESARVMKDCVTLAPEAEDCMQVTITSRRQ